MIVNIENSPTLATVPYMASESRETRTRGFRKKERTRQQLITAGLRVLAAKGQGLTVSDVAAEAGVSNGTFYNYFADREELVEALAAHSMLALAAATAGEPIEDPARRFALATTRVLARASDEPTWARALLRLVSRPDSGVDLARYLREDLAEGQSLGRFDVGPDDAVLDQVVGLIVMTIRRIAEGQAAPDSVERAVERALRGVGLGETEAMELAREARNSLQVPDA